MQQLGDAPLGKAFGNALCGARLPIASIKIGSGQEASTRLSGKAEWATSSSIGAERVLSSVSSLEASLEAKSEIILSLVCGFVCGLMILRVCFKVSDRTQCSCMGQAGLLLEELSTLAYRLTTNNL